MVAFSLLVFFLSGCNTTRNYTKNDNLQRLRAGLSSWNKASRLQAIKALGEKETSSDAEAHALLPLLADKDWWVRSRTCWALGRIASQDSKVVQALKSALSDTHSLVRQTAAWALGSIGAGASPAIPDLKKTLISGNQHLKEIAAAALYRIGVRALPALISLLKHKKDNKTREQALESLGYFGKQGLSAVPALLKVLEETKSGVEYRAAHALSKIGAGNKAVLKTIQQRAGLKHPYFVRKRYNWLLYHLKQRLVNSKSVTKKNKTVNASPRPKNPQSVKDWIQVLPSPTLSLYEYVTAPQQLANKGSAGIKAIPALLVAYHRFSPKHGMAHHNRRLLHSIHKMGPVAIPMLLRQVQTSSLVMARVGAMKVLEMFGEKSASAVPVLTTLLKHRSEKLAGQAVRTLGFIGQKAAPAIPSMLQLFQQQRAAFETYRALQKMGPALAPSLPALVQLFQQTPRLQSSILPLFGHMGEKAESAVPLLLKYLKKHKHSYHRHAIFESLGRIGSKKMIPLLLQELKASSSYHRPQIVTAIGRTARRHPQLLSVLVRCWKDPNHSVRLEAAIALGRLGKKAVPALLTLFSSSQNNKQKRPLAQALSLASPDKKRLVRMFSMAFRQAKTTAQKVESLVWLGFLKKTPEMVLPLVLQSTRSTNPMIRKQGFKLLAGMRLKPSFFSKAIIAIQKGLHDPRPSVRMAALKATKHAQGKHSAFVKGWKRTLSEKQFSKTTADILRTSYRQKAKELAPELLKACDAKILAEQTCSTTLYSFGPTLIPLFESILLKGKSSQSRLRAALLLSRFNSQTATSRAALKSALSDKNTRVRIAAGLTLLKWGVQDLNMETELLRLMKKERLRAFAFAQMEGFLLLSKPLVLFFLKFLREPKVIKLRTQSKLGSAKFNSRKQYHRDYVFRNVVSLLKKQSVVDENIAVAWMFAFKEANTTVKREVLLLLSPRMLPLLHQHFQSKLTKTMLLHFLRGLNELFARKKYRQRTLVQELSGYSGEFLRLLRPLESHSSLSIRVFAATALLHASHATRKTLPILVKALKARRRFVQKRALETLALFPSRSKIHSPDILQQLDTQDMKTRFFVSKLHSRLLPKEHPTLKQVLKKLSVLRKKKDSVQQK
jgi:HEAT repeat protein